MRWALCVAGLLLIVPVAEALDVATRTAKVRPSEEYSPDTAWELGYYGCGVTVAIFDEGVDDEHPWLKGKVVAGVDVTATQTLWTQANGGNPQPIRGTHGTPVAGMVASHAGQPMFQPGEVPDWAADDRVGPAPCAWLVDVQFNDIVGASTNEMVAAFDWAIANKDNDWGDADPLNDGIDIITMSWSPNDETDGSDPVCQAATRAVDAGIVVLGSAGNSGSLERPDLGCPTGADGAISVANVCDGHPSSPSVRSVTREDDQVCTHSTWGPRTDDGDDDPYEELKPDIASPGQNVISVDDAYLDGREYQYAGCGDDSTLGNPPGARRCDAPFGGTSAATPFTAGVVALMLEANGNLTGYDVREILHQTAEPWPDQADHLTFPEMNAKFSQWYSYGFIDAYAAVRMAETWPGLALGQDLDSDGVRDFLDEAPTDPAIATIKQVLDEVPVGGSVDTDGDGIVDELDGAPLDPFSAEREEEPVSDDRDASLGGLIAALAIVLAGIAVRRP